MKKFLLASIVFHSSLIILVIIIGLTFVTKNYTVDKVNVYLTKNSPLRQSVTVRVTGKQLKEYKKHWIASPGKKRQVRNEESLVTTPNKKRNRNDKSWIATRIKRARNDRKMTKDILHNLIQDQIRYPKNLNLYNKRNAELYFVLFPDGHIESEKITKSSNATILDRAALEGIKELSKIKIGKNLVEKPTEFKVPIEFL